MFAGRAVVHLVHGAPEIGEFQAEDDVSLIDQCTADLIEVMIVRHVHAAELIDHRRIQRLGKLDQMLDAGRRARHAVCDDHRVVRHGEQARSLAHRVRIAGGRRDHVELGNGERLLAL